MVRLIKSKEVTFTYWKLTYATVMRMFDSGCISTSGALLTAASWLGDDNRQLSLFLSGAMHHLVNEILTMALSNTVISFEARY